MKSIFINIIVLIFATILSTQSVMAETYIREYFYEASETDSKVSSRNKALSQIKTLFLEELGTRINSDFSYQVNENGNVKATSKIDTFSSGVTQLKILEEDWNGDTYYVKCEIKADENEVKKLLKSQLDKTQELSKQFICSGVDNDFNWKVDYKLIETSEGQVFDGNSGRQLEVKKSNPAHLSVIDEYQSINDVQTFSKFSNKVSLKINRITGEFKALYLGDNPSFKKNLLATQKDGTLYKSNDSDKGFRMTRLAQINSTCLKAE